VTDTPLTLTTSEYMDAMSIQKQEILHAIVH